MRSTGRGLRPVFDSDIYRQVAWLHIASLDRGFLTTLGERFLALLY